MRPKVHFARTSYSQIQTLSSRMKAPLVFLSLAVLIVSATFLPATSQQQYSTSSSNNSLFSIDRQADQLPNLQGEEAVEYLKEQGLYASLGEAMKAARYGVYESRHSLRARPDEEFYAENPLQKYEAYFSPESVRLSTGEGDRLEVGVKLKGAGYGDRQQSVTPGQPTVKGSRIEIERSVRSHESGVESQIARSSDSGLQTPDSRLIEWYVNREEGLEQGFTLERAPGKAEEGQ